MDIVFYFHFYDHSNDFMPSRSLAFYAANLNTNLNTTSDELNERIACCAEDMDAKYGEHCGLLKLTCAGTTLIGYCSSDIHGERCQQVMHAWRTTFLKQFSGCVVSDVCDVTNENGSQILERTQQAYEQQQAQLLRDTLNTQVATAGSSAAAKKM